MNTAYFYAFMSSSGKLDSNITRVWVTEEKIIKMMRENEFASFIRISTNQMAVLQPESDRLFWIDIKEKDIDL